MKLPAPSVLLITLACVACGKSPAREHDRQDDVKRSEIDRAIELRDQAASSTPVWPAATKWLVTSLKIERAIDHDKELIAISGSAIVRVPKDGSPAQQIAEIPNTRIDEVAVTSSSIIVTAFGTVDGQTASRVGAVWAIPLAGGKPKKLAEVPILSRIAAFGPSLWVANEKQIFAAKEPALAKLAPLALDKRHYTQALVADARGAWWTEAEYETKNGDWIRSIDHAFEIPMQLVLGAIASDGARIFVLGGDSHPAATAGGDTYYEASNSIVAVDDQGKVQPISPPLGEAWDFKLAGTMLCAVQEGPKLEFGKRTKVIALATDGSKHVTELATGIDHADVIAADATTCYVTARGRTGIAAVPAKP